MPTELRALTDRVAERTCDRDMESESWERAVAMNGLIAVDRESERVEELVDRAVATQTSEGHLAYGWGDSPGDWAEHADYDVRDYSPTANTAVLAYPVLEWYERTSDDRYLDAARRQYEAFDSVPRTEDGGISRRLGRVELFTEPLYFLCPFFVRYGRIVGDDDPVEAAIDQVSVHLKHLLDPHERLFRHIWRETPNTYPGSAFWARANGWATAGLVDVLDELPADHAARASVADDLAEVLDVLVDLQDASGFWRQRLDDRESPLETSGTLMFVYTLERSLAAGIVEGDRFARAAEAGMDACAGVVDGRGDVHRVSKPPASAHSPLGVTSYGQGWFLLAAAASEDG